MTKATSTLYKGGTIHTGHVNSIEGNIWKISIGIFGCEKMGYR